MDHELHHTYPLGTMQIENPVIVLLPADNQLHTFGYVCSDSVTSHLCDSTWTMRPDVYLYIDDEDFELAPATSHASRLGMAAVYFAYEDLLSKENDTCIYRNCFPSSTFDVFMRVTQYDTLYAEDEVYLTPVVDTYRIGVKPHYTHKQENKWRKLAAEWEQHVRHIDRMQY